MKKKDEIIDQMIDNMPFNLSANIRPYIKEAMDIYAQQEVKKCNIPAVKNWVFASDKLPSVEENGNKVILYRIMNDSQESLAISIHETSMVKYCNLNETWWIELPKPPFFKNTKIK